MAGEQCPWPYNVVPLHSGRIPRRLAAEFFADCKEHSFVAVIMNGDGGVLRVYEKDVTPDQRRAIQALLATMEETDG